MANYCNLEKQAFAFGVMRKSLMKSLVSGQAWLFVSLPGAARSSARCESGTFG